jgi:hypothetical protein
LGDTNTAVSATAPSSTITANPVAQALSGQSAAPQQAATPGQVITVNGQQWMQLASGKWRRKNAFGNWQNVAGGPYDQAAPAPTPEVTPGVTPAPSPTPGANVTPTATPQAQTGTGGIFSDPLSQNIYDGIYSRANAKTKAAIDAAIATPGFWEMLTDNTHEARQAFRTRFPNVSEAARNELFALVEAYGTPGNETGGGAPYQPVEGMEEPPWWMQTPEGTEGFDNLPEIPTFNEADMPAAWAQDPAIRARMLNVPETLTPEQEQAMRYLSNMGLEGFRQKASAATLREMARRGLSGSSLDVGRSINDALAFERAQGDERSKLAMAKMEREDALRDIFARNAGAVTGWDQAQNAGQMQRYLTGQTLGAQNREELVGRQRLLDAIAGDRRGEAARNYWNVYQAPTGAQAQLAQQANVPGVNPTGAASVYSALANQYGDAAGQAMQGVGSLIGQILAGQGGGGANTGGSNFTFGPSYTPPVNWYDYEAESAAPGSISWSF